jgi:hypothetical protein
MTIVLYVVAAVFGAKLVWNLILPIELERRIRRGQAKRTSGVSAMIGVELALLLIVVAVSAVTAGLGGVDRGRRDRGVVRLDVPGGGGAGGRDAGHEAWAIVGFLVENVVM